MSEELERELQRFRTELEGIADGDALYDLSVRFLGKKGSITQLRKQMGKLTPDERKAFGQAFNATKTTAERELAARKQTLAEQARAKDLARNVDLTMLPRRGPGGNLHIVTQTRRKLEQVFRGLGFEVLDGPHVEHEKYNFDDLNIAADHPARDMQDTFFIKPPAASTAPTGGSLVLRTHTSPVQIRAMLARTPPVRMVAMGATFRKDEDPTHSPMFHQIEGLYVDKGVHMADLKATLYRFVGEFFGKTLEVRFRPSFFPFVEPGAEFDLQCPFCSGKGCSVCKGTGWLELGGSGMVHPNVFKAVGYDPEVYTGWAFGFGIDRMAMLLHQVDNLGYLFNGDVRFLEQFSC